MSTQVYDLGLIGGTIVSPTGREQQNLYVREGKIGAVTHERMRAAREIDVSGLLVLPGMIDTHVHFMDPGDPSREDFPTGSRAAICNGVTTVVEHTHGWPVRTPSELEQKLEHLRGRSYVDFGLAAHVWPDSLHHIPALWAAGIDMFKIFTCNTHGVPAVAGATLRDALAAIAEIDGLALIHAEDDQMTAADEARLLSEGREDPGVIPEWRSLLAEQLAVAAAVQVARVTGARAGIAHASSPAVVELVERLRNGTSIFIESCPQYFYLLEEEILQEGPLRKFTPPARAHSPDDLDRMWELLAAGRIDYISSDHAPATREQKFAENIWKVHFGLPGIDTTFAVMLDAALQGRISLERLVEIYSAAPARIHRMYPRKGHLGVGADADIVVVDPHESRTLSDSAVISKAGWTPYHGRTVRGRVRYTFLRGIMMVDQGVVTGELSGRYLPGPGYHGER